MTSTPATRHGLSGRADAGAFLARLVRIDPAAPVRLRPLPRTGGPAGPATAVWARLPWEVLVTRAVAGAGPIDSTGNSLDATVGANDLLTTLTTDSDDLPSRRDADWRWSLPPASALSVDTIPARVLADTARAAATVMRESRERIDAGDRVIREALLDHIAIVVESDNSRATGIEPVRVAQRMIQAVVRMGFLGDLANDPEAPVDVRVAGPWVELAAPYGSAWLRQSGGFTLNTHIVHTFGQPAITPPVRQLT